MRAQRLLVLGAAVVGLEPRARGSPAAATGPGRRASRARRANARKTIRSRPGNGAPASVVQRDEQRRGDRHGAAHAVPRDEGGIASTAATGRARGRAGRASAAGRWPGRPRRSGATITASTITAASPTSDQPSSPGEPVEDRAQLQPDEPEQQHVEQERRGSPRTRRPGGASARSSARACTSPCRRRR